VWWRPGLQNESSARAESWRGYCNAQGSEGPSKPIQTPTAMRIADTAMIVRSIVSHIGIRRRCLSIVCALSPGALWTARQ